MHAYKAQTLRVKHVAQSLLSKYSQFIYKLKMSFSIRFWALSKDPYRLILSLIPTAEHTVVSTLTRFM